MKRKEYIAVTDGTKSSAINIEGLWKFSSSKTTCFL